MAKKPNITDIKIVPAENGFVLNYYEMVWGPFGMNHSIYKKFLFNSKRELINHIENEVEF